MLLLEALSHSTTVLSSAQLICYLVADMLALQGLDPKSPEARKAIRGDTSMVGLTRHLTSAAPKRKLVIDMTAEDEDRSALPEGGHAPTSAASQDAPQDNASQAEEQGRTSAAASTAAQQSVLSQSNQTSKAPTAVDAAARAAAMAAVEAAVVHRPQV